MSLSLTPVFEGVPVETYQGATFQCVVRKVGFKFVADFRAHPPPGVTWHSTGDGSMSELWVTKEFASEEAASAWVRSEPRAVIASYSDATTPLPVQPLHR